MISCKLERTTGLLYGLWARYDSEKKEFGSEMRYSAKLVLPEDHKKVDMGQKRKIKPVLDSD